MDKRVVLGEGGVTGWARGANGNRKRVEEKEVEECFKEWVDGEMPY